MEIGQAKALLAKDELKATPPKSYSLEDIYNRKFVFQDIYSPRDRYLRYDQWSHRDLWDDEEKVPSFISFLKSHGHEKVEKFFPTIGLEDKSQDACPPKRGEIVDKVFRTLDIYLTNFRRESFVTAFRQAQQERKDIKNILAGTTVVFSANPWDIATMSMRGISSCMSWHNTHARHLAGSMLDPYCATIFLENTYPPARGASVIYGSNMVARSVVRYVRHGNKYKVLLERVYTVERNPAGVKVDLITQLFKDYLSNNTKLPVIEPSAFSKDMRIPFSPELPALSEQYRSYRDSHIEYDSFARTATT